MGIVTNKDINSVRAKHRMGSFSRMNSNTYNGISQEEFMGYLDGLLYRIHDSKGSVKNIISGFEKIIL